MEKVNILNRIEELRKEKNWTRNELAQNAGLSSGMIYQWYNSPRIPSLKTVEELCQALDISLSFFFADNQSEKITAKQNKLMQVARKLSEKQIDTLIDVGNKFIEK